ncbi:MAG: hypothetical protein U0Q55_00020 [Vicinamibacterales bacterium]
MKTIQVDMFAVGLGAAILTQFRLADGQAVSVLADGGMGPGDYPADGVHDKIGEAFQSFPTGMVAKRIDLMVGTHYDADHLKGLIPIAADDAIEIGEVWLPPIKDDTDEIPGHLSEAGSYLAQRFYDDEGERELLRYLKVQRQQVEEILAAEARVLESLAGEDERPYRLELPHYRRLESRRQLPDLEPTGRETGPSTEDYVQYFEAHELDAAALTGTGSAHGSATYDSSVKDIRDIALSERPFRYYVDHLESIDARGLTRTGLRARRVMPAMLASIRKSTAAKAITAVHLHKLVQALRARSKPVRPQCHYIAAGKPVRFVWSDHKRRFTPRQRGGEAELVVTLLGPCDRLVEKHRSKLPVGSYMYALSMSRAPIRLEGITESNQLSYIFTMEMAGQRVLISGDAGCYDFKDDDDEYFPRLLKALMPLHVIQVAHHAGHNYDFYNTLLSAKFAEQRAVAYLLLSHDVHDKTRPSAAFGQFIAEIRKHDDDVVLLFTSQPTEDKVADYDELVHAVAPSGSPPSSRGDVRLCYGPIVGGVGWAVERHSVSV